VKLNLAYRFNRHYWLGWRTYFTSARDTGLVQPDHTAAYSISHISLLAHPWHDNLELAAHVYNVFDHAYRHPLDISSYPQASLPQARRTFGLSARYRF